MRKRISAYTLFVIILSELVGLSVILYLRYCLDIQTSMFNVLVEQVFEVEEDVEQIRSLLYKYEYDMVSELYSDKAAEAETKEKLTKTELEIRSQIIHHGELMYTIPEKTERYALFRSVNDDVLNYLNYNAALLSMKGNESYEAIQNFTDSYIIPLMDRVNASIDELSALSKNYIADSKAELTAYLIKTRIICFASFILMIFSIIVSILHSHRALTSLESDNQFLKFKSDVNEIRISEIQNNTVMGIADLVESRSGETGQHVKRTSHLVNLILLQAKKHNKWPEALTDRYIDFVTRAAPMHDIGKIVISDTILNKPGKLTDDEFEIMKTHAAAGSKIVYEILGGVEDIEYVDIAADIAYFHHEKWNGKGYPTGKKGTEIPLCARIMAVADVFDALVSERCYKKPMPYDDAFELIKNEAGQHFDPEVVELFLEMKDEIKAEK
ncbi:HD-GYP domain-containing protein [Treponema sp.]|uniref:HD-GYP domain-containing protein n=1 Tax=Treponema sp. TaxID=166 RepID=UPI00388F9038